METYKEGNEVVIRMSVPEAAIFISKIGEQMGAGEDEMSLIYEELFDN